jgi:DNA-binding transcriptional ArsR family regulator
MLDLLAERQRTTGELSSAFAKLSRFAVMKHLRVLHAAGLISIRREGRVRWNALNPVPLREVFRKWVSQHEAMWADVMLDIRDAAEGSAGSPHQKQSAAAAAAAAAAEGNQAKGDRS